MDLTTRQRHALRNPCFAAQETRHPSFGWRLPPPFDDATAVLTLNVGME